MRSGPSLSSSYLRRIVRASAFSLVAGVAFLLWGCEEKTRDDPPTASAPERHSVVPWDHGSGGPYSLRMQSHLDTSLAMGRVEFDLKATVVVFVDPAVGDDRSLLVQIADAQFSGQNSEGAFQDLAEELTRPCGAVMRHGALVEERLSPGISKFAASIQRTVLAALQVSDRVGDGPWSATEYDSSGQYEARWQDLGDGTYSRMKTQYVPVKVAAPGFPDQKIAPRVAHSEGKYVVDQGRLVSAKLAERIALDLGAKRIESETELSLVRSAAKAPEIQWQTIWNQTKAHKPGQPYGGEVDPSVFDQQRIGSHTYESALKVLVREEEQRRQAEQAGVEIEPENREQGHARAFTALAAILRTQPDARKRAAARIPRGGPQAGILANALASSGVAASQAELVRLLATDNESKHAAARSLVRVENPTPETVLAVRGLCNDTRYLKFCYYGAGSFSRRLRGLGQVERANELSAFLLEAFKSKAPDERIIVLRGLANAAAPESVPWVAPLLHAKDQREREAATDALRLVPGDEVDALLSERLESDVSVGVRTSVVSAALVREPSTVLEHAVVQAALSDENSGVRKQAVRALARWLEDAPRLRAPLEKVATEDQNKLVKSYAQAALSKERAHL